jgi:hypothetical protein
MKQSPPVGIQPTDDWSGPVPGAVYRYRLAAIMATAALVGLALVPRISV